MYFKSFKNLVATPRLFITMAREESDREIAELLLLFSLFDRRQHPVIYPTERDPVPRKLSAVHGSFQDPIDVHLLPPPERFLKKQKKDRSRLKQASPQAFHSKLKHVEDTTSEDQDGEEYDRVLAKLLSVDG
jgi:hypothetical protein